MNMILSVAFAAMLAPPSATHKNLTPNLRPQVFIENKGQWDPSVLFHAEAGGTSFWLTRDGAQFDVHRTIQRNGKSFREGQRLWLEPINRQVKAEGSEAARACYSYFVGDESSGWASKARTFQKAIVPNLFPGVDQVFYFDQGAIRYDYVLKPGVDPSVIKMRLRGADSVSVVNDALVCKTKLGAVTHKGLTAYQVINGKRVPVACNFTLKNGQLGFGTKGVQKNQPLVIDPIVWSKYLGSDSDEFNSKVTAAPDGWYYTTCQSRSDTFDNNEDGYYLYNSGYYDVFVSLHDDDGDLVAGTYLGGKGAELNSNASLRSDGLLFVAGATESTNFPTTPGAYMRKMKNRGASFVTLLSPDLDQIVGSTLFDVYDSYSDGNNHIGGIVALSNGEVVAAGGTNWTGFPVTANALQSSFAGNYDGYLIQLSGDLKRLVYGTYFGGTDYDVVHKLALCADGSLVVAGYTESNKLNNKFPILNAYMTEHNEGQRIGFVAKLSSAKKLTYSTFFGPEGVFDYRTAVRGLAVSGTGEAYIGGYCYTGTLPVSTTSYLGTVKPAGDNSYVGRISTDGKKLVGLTYVGGSNSDYLLDLALDGTGRLILVGETNSPDTLVKVGANVDVGNYQAGSTSAFVLQLLPDLTKATYGTFLQGSADDECDSVALMSDGSLQCAGATYSADFPIFPIGSSFDSPAWDCFHTRLTLGSRLKALSVAPAPNVPSGSTFQVLVELDKPATVATTVTLRDDSDVTSLGSAGTDVVIPAGAASVIVDYQTTAVAAVTQVPITATQGLKNVSGIATVVPPAVVSLTLAPTTVKGGVTAKGTITLSTAAGVGAPVTVRLSSTDTTAASVPASIVIPAGSNTAVFNITTKVQTTTKKIRVKALTDGGSKEANLSVTK